MKIHVASRNPKKLRELARVLDAAGIDGVELFSTADVAPYEEPVENGRTFTDNALIKARAGAAATGLVTLADDSGLTVDELGGMPGVLSARWSGQHGDDAANNALLLAQMADVRPPGSRFCVRVRAGHPGRCGICLRRCVARAFAEECCWGRRFWVRSDLCSPRRGGGWAQLRRTSARGKRCALTSRQSARRACSSV